MYPVPLEDTIVTHYILINPDQNLSRAMANDNNGKQKQQDVVSNAGAGDKGKGKATASESDPAPGKPRSLLSSVLSPDASSTAGALSSIVDGTGKAGASTGGGSAAAHLASERHQPSSTSTSSSSVQGSGAGWGTGNDLGPRPGFRESSSRFGSPIPSTEGYQLVHGPSAFDPRAETLQQHQSTASSGFGTFDALNRGLYDLIRQESGDVGSREQGEGAGNQGDFDIRTALSNRPELLDPAYHEAWARTIPGSVNDQSHSYATGGVPGQESTLNDAWSRAAAASPHAAPVTQQSVDVRPEYPIDFMEKLRLEEEAEAAAEEAGQSLSEPQQQHQVSAATPDTTLSLPPPPEPSSALQSTDPREALSFLLGPTDEQKSKLRAELQRLAEQIQAAQERDRGVYTTHSGESAPAPSQGLDRKSRRRERRRQLAQIEYELEVLERKAGYVEVSSSVRQKESGRRTLTQDLLSHYPHCAAQQEVWSTEEQRPYPSAPDFSSVDDDEDDRAADESAQDLEERRKRAIERLNSLRRHLDAKL